MKKAKKIGHKRGKYKKTKKLKELKALVNPDRKITTEWKDDAEQPSFNPKATCNVIDTTNSNGVTISINKNNFVNLKYKPTFVNWKLTIEIDDDKKIIELFTKCYNDKLLNNANYEIESFFNEQTKKYKLTVTFYWANNLLEFAKYLNDLCNEKTEN